MKLSNIILTRCIATICVASVWLPFKALASEETKEYNSYEGLVMAGYQGWFNTPDDGAGLGWRHYGGKNGFKPGSCTVDVWPEMREYSVCYPTEFHYENGDAATVFSSHDKSTTDTHFRWMKEYGIDGVFMQRFVCDIKNEKIKKHFDHVLGNAMEASRKYNRAISIMYDLSGMKSEDVDFILEDLSSLDTQYSLHDRTGNSSYLYHNGKPLVAVWGVGFNDGRSYSLEDADKIINALKDKGFSVMLGVPTYWREFGEDTENNLMLHTIIRKCDIIMPWFVGRYNEDGFEDFSHIVAEDLNWCERNSIDYAPLCYPGFSWANMKGKDTLYIPRNHGKFFKKQLDNAIECGANMIYVAMFDEIDEGTAIFKCAANVPVPYQGTEFRPIESASETDLYLRLAGNASKRLKSIH